MQVRGPLITQGSARQPVDEFIESSRDSYARASLGQNKWVVHAPCYTPNIAEGIRLYLSIVQ